VVYDDGVHPPQTLPICVPAVYNAGFPICPLSYQIAGNIKTENDVDAVEEVAVSSESYPDGICKISGLTDFQNNPNYALCICPEYTSYKITPNKIDNPLNGVTTYDLVLISKH
jgi:hypothetical protein